MNYKQLIIGLFVGLMLGASMSSVFAQDQENKRPEVVMREGLAPTRAAANGNAQITLFAEGEHGFMGKLRMAGGAKVPEHQDESEEFLYVLKGEGTITVDGTEYDVTPNTGIFLPAGAKVSYQNGDRVMEALQFFAPTDSANKYSGWETGQTPMTDKPRGERSKRGGSSGGGE